MLVLSRLRANIVGEIFFLNIVVRKSTEIWPQLIFANDKDFLRFII